MTNDDYQAKHDAPPLIAYAVREREGKQAIWTRIGCGWPHGDGKGMTADLEAIPAAGTRLVFRERKPDDAAQDEDRS